MALPELEASRIRMQLLSWLSSHPHICKYSPSFINKISFSICFFCCDWARSFSFLLFAFLQIMVHVSSSRHSTEVRFITFLSGTFWPVLSVRSDYSDTTICILFFCHSHSHSHSQSALCNIYPVALDRNRR